MMLVCEFLLRNLVYLKSCWCLTLLPREGVGGAQKAEHLIHHVGVVDGLLTCLLHLLHHLLLAPRLLALLLLALGVLPRQLRQALLVLLLRLCLRPLGAHLVPQLLLLRQTQLLCLQAPPVLLETQTKINKQINKTQQHRINHSPNIKKESPSTNTGQIGF